MVGGHKVHEARDRLHFAEAHHRETLFLDCDKNKKRFIYEAFQDELNQELQTRPTPTAKLCTEYTETGQCQYGPGCAEAHIEWNVYVAAPISE